jgi:hypothetical protein
VNRVVAVLAQEAFHLIFEVEFLLFQGEFFDLLGFREVVAICVVVEPFVEIVMLGGELAILLVALQEFTLQLFEVCRHLRLLVAL